MKYLSFLFLITLAFACKPQKGANSKNMKNQFETTEMPQMKHSEQLEENIVGKEIIYDANGQKMVGYLAYNENTTTALPGILIIHDWWGHDDFVRKKADLLAGMGYVAFAIDMYGDGKQVETAKDAQALSTELLGNIETVSLRFEAALLTLKGSELVQGENIAAVGYGFGGNVALTMAQAGEALKGVAAFHSSLDLPNKPLDQGVMAQILVQNGEEDSLVSKENVLKFEAQLIEAGVNYQYVTYPKTQHAFTDPKADNLAKKHNLPLAYNAENDAISWQRLQEFFSSVFL